MMTDGNGLRATSIEIPDPILRGRRTLVWVIHDTAKAEIDRFPGFGRITDPEQAITHHLERAVERAAAAVRSERMERTAAESPRPTAAPVRRVAPVRPGLLYHFTTGEGLLGILGDDAIRAASMHVLRGRAVPGVSLTRDRWFEFEARKPFRLALDLERMPGRPRTFPIRDAYMQGTHKAHPIYDGVRKTPTNEAEEFHVGPLRSICSGLVEIALMEDLLDVPDGDPGALRAVAALVDVVLPDGVKLLVVDRRRSFGDRERLLDPTAYGLISPEDHAERRFR